MLLHFKRDDVKLDNRRVVITTAQGDLVDQFEFKKGLVDLACDHPVDESLYPLNVEFRGFSGNTEISIEQYEVLYDYVLETCNDEPADDSASTELESTRQDSKGEVPAPVGEGNQTGTPIGTPFGATSLPQSAD